MNRRRYRDGFQNGSTSNFDPSLDSNSNNYYNRKEVPTPETLEDFLNLEAADDADRLQDISLLSRSLWCDPSYRNPNPSPYSPFRDPLPGAVVPRSFNYSDSRFGPSSRNAQNFNVDVCLHDYTNFLWEAERNCLSAVEIITQGYDLMTYVDSSGRRSTGKLRASALVLSEALQALEPMAVLEVSPDLELLLNELSSLASCCKLLKGQVKEVEKRFKKCRKTVRSWRTRRKSRRTPPTSEYSDNNSSSSGLKLMLNPGQGRKGILKLVRGKGPGRFLKKSADGRSGSGQWTLSVAPRSGSFSSFLDLGRPHPFRRMSEDFNNNEDAIKDADNAVGEEVEFSSLPSVEQVAAVKFLTRKTRVLVALGYSFLIEGQKKFDVDLVTLDQFSDKWNSKTARYFSCLQERSHFQWIIKIYPVVRLLRFLVTSLEEIVLLGKQVTALSMGYVASVEYTRKMTFPSQHQKRSRVCYPVHLARSAYSRFLRYRFRKDLEQRNGASPPEREELAKSKLRKELRKFAKRSGIRAIPFFSDEWHFYLRQKTSKKLGWEDPFVRPDFPHPILEVTPPSETFEEVMNTKVEIFQGTNPSSKDDEKVPATKEQQTSIPVSVEEDPHGDLHTSLIHSQTNVTLGILAPSETDPEVLNILDNEANIVGTLPRSGWNLEGSQREVRSINLGLGLIYIDNSDCPGPDHGDDNPLSNSVPFTLDHNLNPSPLLLSRPPDPSLKVSILVVDFVLLLYNFWHRFFPKVLQQKAEEKVKKLAITESAKDGGTKNAAQNKKVSFDAKSSVDNVNSNSPSVSGSSKITLINRGQSQSSFRRKSSLPFSNRTPRVRFLRLAEPHSEADQGSHEPFNEAAENLKPILKKCTFPILVDMRNLNSFIFLRSNGSTNEDLDTLTYNVEHLVLLFAKCEREARGSLDILTFPISTGTIDPLSRFAGSMIVTILGIHKLTSIPVHDQKIMQDFLKLTEEILKDISEGQQLARTLLFKAKERYHQWGRLLTRNGEFKIEHRVPKIPLFSHRHMPENVTLYEDVMEEDSRYKYDGSTRMYRTGDDIILMIDVNEGSYMKYPEDLDDHQLIFLSETVLSHTKRLIHYANLHVKMGLDTLTLDLFEQGFNCVHEKILTLEFDAFFDPLCALDLKNSLRDLVAHKGELVNVCEHIVNYYKWMAKFIKKFAKFTKGVSKNLSPVADGSSDTGVFANLCSSCSTTVTLESLLHRIVGLGHKDFMISVPLTDEFMKDIFEAEPSSSTTVHETSSKSDVQSPETSSKTKTK